MSTDRETLENYLEAVADKYTCGELLELLEDAGVVTIWDVIALLEEFIVEGREHLGV